jgi:D-glycero-D-manno-heptose 1,7-bisphosphate phosphatase
MTGGLEPAVFLDRDGTLMREVEYCRDPALVELLPGVLEGLKRLQEAGFRLVIITNQSGIGRGWITLPEYESVHGRLMELLGSAFIDSTYFCPDHPDFPTERRKPAPGMLLEAARERRLDLESSFFIGDRHSDVECARSAGVQAVLVHTGYGATENPDGAAFVARDFAAAVDFILTSVPGKRVDGR